MTNSSNNTVNFTAPRGFGTTFRTQLKETLFPDDPFKQINIEKKPLNKAKKAAQYFLPILSWLPKYRLGMFTYDFLAGLTITSLAIPQGISYAKLGNIPPIIGLYSSFIPPLVYAIFGSSNNLAVGTVAASTLMIAESIGQVVSYDDDPTLYVHLVFTAAFITGIFQTTLGLLRLGILVDYLSHSTITGFMGGTAVIIILQQLKGFLGLIHFTSKTDVVSVAKAIFKNRVEWKWEPVVLGAIFLVFLQCTKYLAKRKPKLFWVSAMAPMVTVIVGCLFAYFADAKKHGIQIVGDLHKGLNPISLHLLNFNSKYLTAVLKAGIIPGILATAEGIAIGRSFAVKKNEQTDGNKEILAYGLMNIVGSFTSCYLTTGPFSKTAVNYNAGCKTPMANVVMAMLMMLTLLFLAPLFSYIPLVSLSAIITSAMIGLIDYEETYHLFKVDKFDFVICMVAFLGVTLGSMDLGLSISVGIGIIRALLYIARPNVCKLGNTPTTSLYRDVEQYPGASNIPGVLILQIGSPMYFANCSYIRERISRWIDDEQNFSDANEDVLEYLLLDLGGITSIDMSGIEALLEVKRFIEAKGIKMLIANPRIKIMEKMMLSKFIDVISKECIFLSIEEAIEACKFRLLQSNKPNGSSQQCSSV